jgi:N-acetylglucosaminyl-diphospho-decaprenol L-rhamnosyltransferase
VTSRVGVVMMTRDRRDQTLNALTHLTALPENPSVVVVDNGSGDGTAAAVRERFPDVTVLGLDHNAGSVARTIGVRALSTPYVAFSDDDSWWAPGSLQLAAERFDTQPRLGLLAARILVGPEEREDPLNAVLAASPLRRRDGHPEPALLGFVACGAVVRREAFLTVGGFSEVIFFLGEETVLSQDLDAAGWEVAYGPDVVAHHHPRRGPAPAHRQRLQLRNELLSIWLRRPPAVIARRTAQVARLGPPGRRALLDALRRLPMVAGHRKSLPTATEARMRLLETQPQGAADVLPARSNPRPETSGPEGSA